MSRTGLILAPYSADYGGRKWTIFLGCLIVVIAGILQCFSVNIHMFTAARFLSKNPLYQRAPRALCTLAKKPPNFFFTVGLGSGFSGLASPLLITEIAHPCERGKITALYKYASHYQGREFK